MKISCLMLIGLGTLTLLMSGCSEPAKPTAPAVAVPRELLQQADSVIAGAELFTRHCRECHGTRSEGRTLRAFRFKPPAPDFLTSDYVQADPAYLYWRINQGKRVEPFYSQGSVMPAFEPYFSDQQIWQLVAYLRDRAAAANR